MKCSFQNVIDGQGVGISITGMLIVFFSLLTISLIVGSLPKILEYVALVLPEKEHGHTVSGTTTTKEDDSMVAAIGVLLQQKG